MDCGRAKQIPSTNAGARIVKRRISIYAREPTITIHERRDPIINDAPGKITSVKACYMVYGCVSNNAHTRSIIASNVACVDTHNTRPTAS